MQHKHGRMPHRLMGGCRNRLRGESSLSVTKEVIVKETVRRWTRPARRGRGPHRRRAAAGRVRQQQFVQQQQPELRRYAQGRRHLQLRSRLGPGQPSSRCKSHEDPRAMQVMHQVFQGLVQCCSRRQRAHQRPCRDLAEKTEVTPQTARRGHLHHQAGRHVRAARQPRGHGAGLRRLVELVTTRGANKLGDLVHPRAGRGHGPEHAATRRVPRAHRRQGRWTSTPSRSSCSTPSPTSR